MAHDDARADLEDASGGLPDIIEAPGLTASGDSRTQIRSGRTRIDELDTQIINLLLARAEISREIQRARTGHGGQRLDPAREDMILKRYREALWQLGLPIGREILKFCRIASTLPR